MQVNRVNNVNFLIPKKQVKINNNITNPMKINAASSEQLSSIYMGKDLVSFGKSFKDTINANYFHLPQGCTPDWFQTEAGKALNENKNVIVEAPTGTGKTAIAHYVVSKNMEEGKTTFYTTPLKALSNQKLKEFREVYGEDKVGILTGDRRENINAPIIIMTTEVFRNMALSQKYGEKADLMNNLGTVIFDECHYMGDISRGSTWEESMMFAPEGVQMLALSATIGNAKQIQTWMGKISPRKISLISVPESERNVPLQFDTLETSGYAAEAKRIENELKRKGTTQNINTEKPSSKPILSDFKNAVNTLSERKQLPAIFFIFSRKFSRELLNYLAEEGPVLTTSEERKEIEKITDKYKSKKYLGNDLNISALKKGYAIHNAGIIPAQKELIEELFQKKLIKAVLATETLAAGINMPAKTVVLSSVYKPAEDNNDEEISLRTLTPNEFKQMSGRAGRRGIDTVGYVYTMPTDMASEQEFLALEAMDSNPLESRYEPEYAFLTGYYKYNSSDDELNNIFKKTFFVHSDDEREMQTKIENLSQLSANKTSVLLERGFINQTFYGIKVTAKGEMASNVKGYNALTLTEALASGKFKDVTPEALALFAGAVANPVRGKENEITLETDLSGVFSQAADNINDLYQTLDNSVRQKITRLGKTFAPDASHKKMLEFVKSVRVPEGANVQEVKEYLDTLSQINTKIYKIQKSAASITRQELVKSLKAGETMPTEVLEKYLQVVENYKKRVNSKDISTYIEKLKAQLEQFDTSDKGKKAKNRIEAKRADVEKAISEAIDMSYLEKALYGAISENYNFIKKYPPKEIRAEYEAMEELYARLTSKTQLTDELEGIIKLKEYMYDMDAKEDNAQNKKSADVILKEMISKGTEIMSTELKNGVNPEQNKYSVSAAQTLYDWAYLNKINPSSITNWKQLLKLIPKEEADEGTIYRRIMQAADLLSQINDMAKAGEKTAENQEEADYYKHLAKTSQEARKLIIKEPVEL